MPLLNTAKASDTSSHSSPKLVEALQNSQKLSEPYYWSRSLSLAIPDSMVFQPFIAEQSSNFCSSFSPKTHKLP